MIRLALGLGVGLLLSGCAYDYVQRSDSVGFRHGDAVRANLEAQTIDPARDSSYSTKGLGKEGAVSPKPATGGMTPQGGADAANAQ